MDGSRFDALARSLAQRSSRRRVLGGLAGSVVGGALAAAGWRRAAAAGCRPVDHRCDDDSDCCSGMCVPFAFGHRNVCAACPDGTRDCGGACIPVSHCCADADCDSGQTCVDGACVAVASGCAGDADCGGAHCCGGACAGCCGDADCPAGQTCQSGTCVAVACANPADCPSEEQIALQLINDYRAQQGLDPLAPDEPLGSAAAGHSLDQATHDAFGHTLVDGTPWYQYIPVGDFGCEPPAICGRYFGENIAAGHSTAADAFAQWQTSPGHEANLSNRNFTAIGIGRAFDPSSTYGWYWTATFGGTIKRTGADVPRPGGQCRHADDCPTGQLCCGGTCVGLDSCAVGLVCELPTCLDRSYRCEARGCCQRDADCDDGDPCTVDLCRPSSHQCYHLRIPPSCTACTDPPFCGSCADCTTHQCCNYAIDNGQELVSFTPIACVELPDAATCGAIAFDVF